MPKYASNTHVPSDRSRSEIESTLKRYGASGFMYGWQGDHAVVAFELNDRRIRFDLPMPDKTDPQFTRTPTGRKRAARQAESEHEQACRQRWRALALVVKAKLEAVECGIAAFDEEFLAYLVLPSGKTVGRWMLPQIERSYRDGTMPALLPAPE